MDRARRRLVMDLVAAVSGLAAVVISASSLGGSVRTAPLLGLVAGSFCAGASLVNGLKEYRAARGAAGRGKLSGRSGDDAEKPA
ncbi:MAG: hypothetical protein QUS11_00895 [Candidatus Fermentibacter sp.]|nr:hypothetical protein [Candidatus Fermentibacter sp.]